jgi:hypothetical protein
MGQAIGALIELRVSELLILQGQGKGIWSAFSLLLKQLMNAGLWYLCNRAVLPGFNLKPFAIRKKTE